MAKKVVDSLPETTTAAVGAKAKDEFKGDASKMDATEAENVMVFMIVLVNPFV